MTVLVTVESREVVRCDICSLVQYRTSGSLCRKCRRPLDIEHEPVISELVGDQSALENFSEVAQRVREIRRKRHLSQFQLAGIMKVPRTYISKIENRKILPTLDSLERLAAALDVNLGELVSDARSRRDQEVVAILSDPFLAELAVMLPHLDSLHRTLLYGSVRDMASGRTALRSK
jgi:transcriptional regulator with XRE-family HTH domain